LFPKLICAFFGLFLESILYNNYNHEFTKVFLYFSVRLDCVRKKMQLMIRSQKKSCHIVPHSGPKMLKSKQRGAGPKFIYHVKGGYIVISKNKIFFKSVEGKFWQFSEKIWAGFPRALPPGISMKQKDKKSKKSDFFLHN